MLKLLSRLAPATRHFLPQQRPIRSFCSGAAATQSPVASESSRIRNIAIIAHVDHGKTTLVDSLLRVSGIVLGEKECAMDSNVLEKEKGITILSKCTSVMYNDHKINIVDTPGHHDFGGEVERIMTMVDGVCLLICATEGPMTQSKFVLRKALEHKLKPIVIINKVDRPSARVKEVENQVFELFCDLNCPDQLLNYPLFYASGKQGWAVKHMEDEKKDVKCIIDSIIKEVSAPKVAPGGKFTMLVSQTQPNSFFGKMILGRINSGDIEIGKKLSSYDQESAHVETSKVTKIIRRLGLGQIEMQRAVAGDIVSVAGFANTGVTHTLCEQGGKTVIPSTKIDPPMMSISINVNTSPMAGKEGEKFTLNEIKTRLLKEMENDVALIVDTSSSSKSNSVSVRGRGDLHLGILLEKMRREGFEMSITPPEILYKTDPKTKELLEPFEQVLIELHPNFATNLIEKMSNRKGTYVNSVQLDPERLRLEFMCPTRGLIGLRTQLLNETQGTATVKTTFHQYQKYQGPMKKNPKGAIVNMAEGITTSYALKEVEKFGSLFVRAGQKVYNGLVIGQNNKEEDVQVNATREKKVTNVRTHSHDEKIVLVPPRTFSIEDAICYVRDDELVEITPKQIRIRKKELDKDGRDRHRREKKNEIKNFNRQQK